MLRFAGVMRRRRRISRLAGSALLAITGCSAFGVSSSVDEEADTVDAGATFDGDGGDGPDLADAGSDDGAPPRPPCPDGAFCDDFDDGPLGLRWTSPEIVRGRLERGSASYVSAPYALRATLDPPDGSAHRLAVLLREFAGVTGLRCSVDLYVEERGTSSRARPLYIVVRNPALLSYELNFWIYPDGTAGLEEWGQRADQTYFYSEVPRFPLPNGTWVRLEIRIDYAGTVHLIVDGVVRAKLDIEPQTPEAVRTRIGIREEDGLGVWTTLFDNVVCVPTPSP
jgi:hypothetical protein